jgi:hypothetical protein
MKKEIADYNPEIEFHLLLLLVSKSLGISRDSEIEKILNNEILWNEVIDLANRHRLIPQLHNVLLEFAGKVPKNVLDRIEQEYQKNVKKMLGFAAENLKMGDLLTENKVPWIPLKGPLMAWQLYGDLGLRQARDIDILVPFSKAGIADELIVASGFIRYRPSYKLGENQAKNYFRYFHDYEYYHPKKGIFLELHWKLFGNKYLFPVTEEELWDNLITREFGGRVFSSFRPEYNFLYLVVHGSLHQWFRLGWLRDVALMLQNPGKLDTGFILQKTFKIGVERSLFQSLYLCRKLFGCDIPPEFANEMHKVERVDLLVNRSLKAIHGAEGRVVTKKIARLKTPFYMASLRDEMKYKLACFAKLGTNAGDWDLIRIPDLLFFLYYPLRPFLYLYNAYFRKEKQPQS